MMTVTQCICCAQWAVSETSRMLFMFVFERYESKYGSVFRHDSVYSVESQPTFRGNISPPSSAWSTWNLTFFIMVSYFACSSPRRWRRHVPPKHQNAFNGVLEIIYQKKELFVVLRSKVIRTTTYSVLKFIEMRSVMSNEHDLYDKLIVTPWP
jgi:hypothetical protein